ncbi:MAG TPA: SDR family oxidoreductase [Gammaproteobacteria bacterium]|nr:SDR family oxidoreductase [Gammaproteobacteria bacterium]
MSNRNEKTVFITGSSSGLGKAAARLFAARGWNVVATMRSPNKEKDLAKVPGITLRALDITDPQQIERAVADTLALGDVDVVFNNAGYGMSGPLEGMTDEQMLRMVQTNLMGPIRVTKAFVPRFRQKRAGLFVNTTSIGGLITVPLNSMYHATKWALEGWSESMSFELGQFGIGLKIVEPGGMRTDFFTRSLDVGRHEAYDALVDKVMGAITDPKQMSTYSTPDDIAKVVYEAATDGKDQLRYLAGADAKATYAARVQGGDEAFRRAIKMQFFG